MGSLVDGARVGADDEGWDEHAAKQTAANAAHPHRGPLAMRIESSFRAERLTDEPSLSHSCWVGRVMHHPDRVKP
jgi:hypothetical protein